MRAASITHGIMLTFTTLQRLVADLHARLAGARLQKIRQAGAGGVVLETFGAGGRLLLLLSARPRLARLHLVREAPRAPEGGAGAFVRALRRELLPGRLIGIGMPGDDRIAILELEGPLGPRRVLLEAFGTSPNLVLLDGEGRLRAQLRPFPPHRRLRPGAPWTPPPPRRSSEEQGPEADDLADLDTAALHRTLEERFGEREQIDEGKALRARLARPLRKELRRTRRRARKLESDISRAGDPDRLRAEAHVLGASLHELLRAGSPSRPDPHVLVLANPGVEGLPEQVTLSWDPARSPQENLDRRYRQARRAERTRLEAGRRLLLLREEEAGLEARLRRVLEASPDALRPMAPAAVGAAPAATGAGTASSRPFSAELLRVARVRELAGGAVALVGKNARANDVLLRRFARGNDGWFHVRDASGSHVILRPPPGAEPSPEAVRQAAALAARHSALGKEPGVDVICARCKHVRKPRNAAPGQVLVAKSRTLRVSPEEAP